MGAVYRMVTRYFSTKLPPPAGVRGVRRSLVQHLGRAVGERTVGDVGVPGDPADVGGAPEDVRLRVDVVHDLVREGGLGQVSARRVQDALGLAGRPGGVKDEQRVLRRERSRLMIGGCRGHRVVPPDVAIVVPRDLVAGALHDEHVFDGLLRARTAVAERLVDGWLERRDPALAVAAVGGDDELRAGVVDARAEAVGGEAAEDDGVDRPDAGDSEHCGDRLGDHRHVDRDAVAVTDAQTLEHVGGPLDLVGQLGIGDAALVARLTLPQQCDAVAVAGLDVPVEAVVGDVELAVGEPLRERWVRPVQHLGERGVPVQAARLLGPECLTVGIRLRVQLRGADGVRGELRRRREPAVLGQQVVDLAAHMRAPLRRTRGRDAVPDDAGNVASGRRRALPPIVGEVTSPGVVGFPAGSSAS